MNTRFAISANTWRRTESSASLMACVRQPALRTATSAPSVRKPAPETHDGLTRLDTGENLRPFRIADADRHLALRDLFTGQHVHHFASRPPHYGRGRHDHACARSEHYPCVQCAARWPVRISRQLHQCLEGTVVGAYHRADLRDRAGDGLARARGLVERHREAGPQLPGQCLRERQHRPQLALADDRDDGRSRRDVIADGDQPAFDGRVGRTADGRAFEPVLGFGEPGARVVQLRLARTLLCDRLFEHALGHRLGAQFLVALHSVLLVREQRREPLDGRPSRRDCKALRLPVEFSQHLAFLH